MSNKIIMIDSPAAAEKVTLTLWKSRRGNLFLEDNEESARHDGCTHRPCTACGEPANKNYTMCNKCQDKYYLKKHNEKPKKEWGGEYPLYSDKYNKYFATIESAEFWAEENKTTLTDMRLILCEPVYARTLDEDYYAYELPEDEELPKIIKDAIDEFNKKVSGLVLSYAPGDYALKL